MCPCSIWINLVVGEETLLVFVVAKLSCVGIHPVYQRLIVG